MPSPTSTSGRSGSAESGLSVRRALLLGAAHGPAELLPISSSAHVTVIPWLLAWDYGEIDPGLRKAFEVALHAGAAAALLLSSRDELVWLAARSGWVVTAAACGPPALAGYALRDRIARGLGTPGTIVAGLLGGSGLMLAADRRPTQRRWQEARMADGLWLGVAQALALVPGVSRAGATTAAARWLGFARRDAKALADQVGLPVLVGAATLELAGLHRLPAAARRSMAAGAGASFASTVLVRAAAADRLGRGSSFPFAVYRTALAGLILTRLRRTRASHRRMAAHAMSGILRPHQGHAAPTQ